MRATSSTLFVCVNTGATEHAGMENATRSKSDTGKPETVTEFNVLQKHMTHTSGPSKPKTINLALRHQCHYVIQFIYTYNHIFAVFALQIAAERH